jgi:hypothetical protein
LCHAAERNRRAAGLVGDDGAVKAGFGKRAQAMASQVHLHSRGRIVLGGIVETPSLSTGTGSPLPRYLSGGG